ncbi:RdgB/HAM1 family non-canonical purine NTP pyrophosphatase [Schleiferia thermophila]|jgi:XTP/dITP diphosphohydrolase|uniref:RdgB/HAM1 family non-canonical purine NTP pyrophosphatase n=1 Tax=Schleiferia thermophila TaxID=884107 RepID=UPI0004E7597C|nr:RdgB/HAM1 family non-canonical purine NTP pyrophosphatase [Schleiferia thermophila]KFD40186.1 deoxyribonucleoside-triphosphatase [Schleiferia thermophila str. Yellowstone]PMB37869.1 non-canonical purine NTP pyrophosphatase [Fischerella thermalis CCMEE 5319]
MIKILLATNNVHKIQELKEMLPDGISVETLKDIYFNENIPENGVTFHENAYAKANFLFERGFNNVLADDSGLEVDALGGLPGVFSARFAGPECDSVKNMLKLLQLMENVTNRTAKFKTVLCFIHHGQTYYFEGEVEGKIVQHPRGVMGFGYDPVFVPEGFQKTFAEMTPEEKNRISHRRKAIEKFIDFISNKSL